MGEAADLAKPLYISGGYYGEHANSGTGSLS